MQAKVPLDVQVIVIEWVYRSSQHQEIDYPTLRACALVCRSWTPVAQRLLFRRVPVPNVSAYFYRIPQITIDLILRTLCAAPYLAAHVRSVICNSEGTDPNSKANDFAILALSTRVDSIFFLERVSPALVSLLSTFPVHPTYIFVNGKSSLVNRVIDIWHTECIQQYFCRKLVDIWVVGVLNVSTLFSATKCWIFS
ncbi:hypothetical protein FA95DRAFT_653525 [Auriscalpium vulgare]|uniref:Uncharacterized protein n=1 Tax=Auriscalpium vulgare TaxID=40419 RepID=A0ACB8RD31_9AGAM|nr:hypothetical protein FA95DRAFT_653525 [Auriscalpium vulgare]